jgi:carbamoyltransferase
MREMINAKVKNRENFRPFAASVLEESSAELFEFKESPFMMFAVPGRPGTSDIISSVVHVDGTSRIQTVSEADNLLFYSLIKRVGEKNGIPVVLNTSFNYAEEPIVCSPDDAYRCFMKTAINYLFLGHYLVTK